MLLLNKTSTTAQALVSDSRIRWVTALILMLAILSIGTMQRHNWPLLLLPFVVAMLVYLIVVSTEQQKIGVKFWIGVAILARFALIFTFPNLSDDIYRFIWDGHSTLQGLNPYQIVPSAYLGQNGDSGLLNHELFQLLNSPDYYSVYPPLSQYFFAIASWVGGENWLFSSIILKLFIFAAECSTIWMMFKMFSNSNRPKLTLLYALNPLVIVELVGNVHFEGIMIWGAVAALYFLQKNPNIKFSDILKSAGALSVAIFVKLLPMFFLPYLWKRLKHQNFMLLISSISLFMLLMALPFVFTITGSGPLESIDLYFHKFEFNASIYYVMRWIGFQWSGFNLISSIGTITPIITLLLFFGLYKYEKRPTIANWPRVILLSSTAFFLMASIVHPWYICGLVAMAPFTRFRYPVVWSALVFISYSAYQNVDVEENLWFVAVEYVIVIGMLVYELLQTHKEQKGSQGTIS